MMVVSVVNVVASVAAIAARQGPELFSRCWNAWSRFLDHGSMTVAIISGGHVASWKGGCVIHRTLWGGCVINRTLWQ